MQTQENICIFPPLSREFIFENAKYLKFPNWFLFFFFLLCLIRGFRRKVLSEHTSFYRKDVSFCFFKQLLRLKFLKKFWLSYFTHSRVSCLLLSSPNIPNCLNILTKDFLLKSLGTIFQKSTFQPLKLISFIIKTRRDKNWKWTIWVRLDPSCETEYEQNYLWCNFWGNENLKDIFVDFQSFWFILSAQ